MVANLPSPMDVLSEIEETIKSRLAQIEECAPVEGLLEKPPLELALRILGNIKEKLEKGEVPEKDDMDLVCTALKLAEMGAQINVEFIMADAFERI